MWAAERQQMLETDEQRAYLAHVAALAGLELGSVELPVTSTSTHMDCGCTISSGATRGRLSYRIA
jgi:hypothetical protein